MNPPTHSETECSTLSRWSRLAWLPIPLLLAAIIAARMAGLRYSYESHTLLPVLSFTFYTLVSLGTLYLIGRSFLGSGSPGLLLLECGVVLWSLAGTIGDFVSHGDANINVTIFNTGILLAGLCHFAGTILSMRPQRVLRAKSLWLGVSCAFALGALWLVSQATLMGWLPVFFIPGHGGTPVRYLVLISAIAMFVLSAALLKISQRGTHLPFTSWYALALLMLAVGLFGVMIQLSLGSVVNWLSRTAQWLGGIYLLFAALASLRESPLPLLPPEKKSHPAYYRDAIAMAAVITAAAIRLTFLSAMGTHSPFLVFYPAVTFAAVYGGLRAGLLATALSAMLADYFWLEPIGLLAIGQPSDWLALVIFLLSGAMIAWVTDAMHSARVRASAAETQALLAAERATASEALLEGRAKLEAALASMTDAVFISDTEGRFIDFNDAFATFHRFKNKDECSKTFAEYPDILDVFMADGTLAPLDQWAVPRALRGETATNTEYTLRRKDTGETWVGSYNFSPVRGKDGVIVGSVVTARDITERKRSEEALQRSEERFRALFNRMTEGFAIHEIITDEHDTPVDYRFLDINPAFERLTGLKREDVVGRTHNDVLPGNDPMWLRIYGAVALTGEPMQFENYAPTLKRHYEVLAYCPAPRQFAVIFMDITARKLAEAKLHRYELLAKHHRDIILFIGLDEGRILEANDAAAKAYGYRYGELMTLTIHNLRAADMPRLTADQIAMAYDHGLLFESVHRRQDGSIFPVEVSAHGAQIDGSRILISVVRDITERKRVESALNEKTDALEARNQQIEAVNKELESFSYSVSHDLRAPLRAIDGYSRMILKKMGEQFDEETKRRFQVIRDNVEAMGQLIDDLLAFSRLGRQEVTKRSLDMEELIRDAWQELITINPDRTMTLKMESMPVAFGDQALIRQVYGNLLGNAVKFTQGKNETVIDAGCSVQNNEEVYYIRDNGIGFDMNFYDKLFGVFQRLHSEEEYKGTGIGLALVQRIIQRHGGRVWAEGKVDNGATFYFTLPIRQE